jgi:nucleotide-binding universal stress UspA family protein
MRAEMKVLLAIDESKCSEAVIESIYTKFRLEKAEIRVLHVVEFVRNSPEAMEWGFLVDLSKVFDAQHKRAEKFVKQVAVDIRESGIEVSTCVREGDPKLQILDVAAEWKADLIVLGSHGRKGMDRFLLGSVSEGVARHATCSVLIVRSSNK